jgi:hypothetical protein
MRFIFFALFLSLVLWGCASKLPYVSTFPLTEKYFHSRDGIFYGKIPTGWFSATDDTLGPSVSVWLLREDFSASITIRELKLNNFSRDQIEKGGLELLARLSAANYIEDGFPPQVEPICFKLKAKEFCSYEISVEGELRRFVLYSAKGRFYECTTRQLKGEWQTTDTQKLFIVQQSILGSIGY